MVQLVPPPPPRSFALSCPLLALLCGGAEGDADVDDGDEDDDDDCRDAPDGALAICLLLSSTIVCSSRSILRSSPDPRWTHSTKQNSMPTQLTLFLVENRLQL